MEQLNKNLALISQQRDFLRRSYQVSRIGIFGSFARGEERPESDVDVLIELEQPIGLFRLVNLENYLSSLLNRRVDRVTKPALKPALKDRILKDVVYA